MAHFEIVRTDAEQPWHARLVASNGQTVWTTENYVDRASAENAVNVLGSITYSAFEADNIRELDERGQS